MYQMLWKKWVHSWGSKTSHLNTLVSGQNKGFLRKKHRNAHGFAWEFLCSCKGYESGRSVQRHGKSSSLHSKKIFLVRGSRFFEWRHKWRTFRPPWPTLPGPGCQPLDGSILLKFLLETRLQSESFDTLDDLLAFWVQKLWSKPEVTNMRQKTCGLQKNFVRPSKHSGKTSSLKSFFDPLLIF